jgi:3-phenylpropionate/trans-cinnamate dioxygenase ferredoxin subunit
MSDLQKVASLSDIPVGQVKAVEFDGEQVVICNVAGSLYAVSDICSHDYALLSEGELTGNEISCPRHGARFDVKTGKALCLPAVVPVETYKVEVKDGDVYVSTNS